MFKRILLGAVVMAAIWLAYQWMTWPDVARLATEAPGTTSFMEIRREELRRDGKNATLLYTWVPYGRISPSLRRAVLVAEDDQFYEHEGVDIKAMQEAIRKDWAKKKISNGGSTITQQLAKNLYLSPSRNPFRKLKEYLLARSLEKHLTKKRILELYLNVVEMGERVYGAEAASRHYFRKAAADLSPAESALLAGSLPNPRIMSPAGPNKRLRARQRMILSRLRRWGYLFEKEVLTAPKPVVAAPEPAATTAPATDTDLAPESTDPTATTGTTEPAVPPPAETDTTSTR